MTARSDILIAIFCMALATLACRWGGYFLMGRFTITPRVEVWLKSIPVALIGSIVGPIVFRGGPPEWAALVICLGVMARFNNDFLAVAASMLTLVGLRQYF